LAVFSPGSSFGPERRPSKQNLTYASERLGMFASFTIDVHLRAADHGVDERVASPLNTATPQSSLQEVVGPRERILRGPSGTVGCKQWIEAGRREPITVSRSVEDRKHTKRPYSRRQLGGSDPVPKGCPRASSAAPPRIQDLRFR
jgi:hypothetical protein